MSTGKLQAVFGEVEPGALAQIENCLADERAVAGALMADAHLGYSLPIGGVIAYDGAISPSGVGFDIACGNKAVQTEIMADTISAGERRALTMRIQQEIEFGIGRSNASPVDDPLFDSPVWDEIDLEPGQPLKQKARAQLGTVGSGNHYVDLLTDEAGYVWVAVHFGSRGFGHTVASWFLAVAQGLPLGSRGKETEEPAMLDVGTPGGDLYLEAMELAGQYAYAGRNYVVEQVLGILGNPKVTESVHCHHNFAWKENGLWVVRKGATPLGTDSAFIGGSMGDISVVVHGRVPHVWRDDQPYGPGLVEDIGALGSAPHGAGRVMSRTKAAGKWRKVNEQRERPDGTTYTFRKRERDASTGLVDWPAVQDELLARGIFVRGSGADEAPAVYKDLATVIAAHPNIQIDATLTPFAVVMAGDDTYDPYQD